MDVCPSRASRTDAGHDIPQYPYTALQMGATWRTCPAQYFCLFRWVTVTEVIRIIGLIDIISGQAIGNVVMLAVSGLIASSSLGWPGIFYISGGFGLVWTVVWIFLGSNSPEVDQRISAEEKEYIQESLGQITDVEELKVRRMRSSWSLE